MKERLKSSDLKKVDIERIQHYNRYFIQQKFAYGKVLDIACGIGYGSKIILENKKVSNYTGGDISHDAINEATASYKNHKTTFLQLDINKTPFLDNSFDYIISNETLEHLKDPEIALKEIARVLSSKGIFTGTVPTKFYDDFFEKKLKVKNNFHLTRFTKEYLTKALKKYFKYVSVLSCTEDIVTRLKKIYPTEPITQNKMYFFKSPNYRNIMGSYLFFATNSRSKVHDLREGFLMGLNYVTHIRNTYSKYLAEKDRYINELEIAKNIHIESLKVKDSYISEIESALQHERQNTLTQKKIFVDKNDTLRSRIIELEKLIKNQDKRITIKDGYIQKLEKKIIKTNEKI